MARVASVSE